MVITLKIKRTNGEVAVLTFDSQPSWEDFAAKIATSFHIQIGAVEVMYTSTDDYVVAIRSQEDLQLYFSRYNDAKAGRLSLIETTQAQSTSPAHSTSVEGSKIELATVAPASDVGLGVVEYVRAFSSMHPRGSKEDLDHYLFRLLSECTKGKPMSPVYVYSSASELARSWDDWIGWARGAGLAHPSDLFIDETEEGARLNIVTDLEKVARDIKYPPELKQTKVNNFPNLRNVKDFVEGILKWATDNSSKAWAEPTVNGRRPLTDALYQSWSTMREAIVEMSVEMSQTIGADAIVQVVFNEQVKGEEDRPSVLREQTIALPSCSPSISDTVVSSAEAGAVVLPEELEGQIMKNLVQAGRGENRKCLQCIESIDIGARIAIPLFVLESKRLEATMGIQKVNSIAERQLAMDMSGCQHQRRALHFEEKATYGATMVGGVFKLFASFWEQGRVVHIDESFADDVSVLQTKFASHEVMTFGETHWKEERRSWDSSRNGSKQLGSLGTNQIFVSGSKRRHSDESGSNKRMRTGDGAGNADQDDLLNADDTLEDIAMADTGGGDHAESSMQGDMVVEGHDAAQDDEEFDARTSSGVDISDDDEQNNSSDTDSHISFSKRPQFVVIRNRRRRKTADISAWRRGERHWLDDEGKPPSTEIRRVVYISSSSSR